MRLLHFSDFHLQSNALLNDSLYTIRPFLKTLSKINQEQEIDLVIFSGDLIDKGGLSFKSIDDAFMAFYDNVLSKICSTLNLSDDRFIICPGNHDIRRSLDTQLTENGCQSTLKTAAEINKFITNVKETNDLTGVKRAEPFKRFLDILYTESENLYISFFESGFKYKIDNKSIGIISYNSSWRAYDDSDKGKLLIGETQLLSGLNFIKDCDFKIAVVHHYFDQLYDSDAIITQKLLQSEFDLLLCGHVHSATNRYVIEPLGKLLTLIAPGTLSANITTDSKKYSNGFSIVDIDFHEAKIYSKFYTYNFPESEFQLNTNIAINGIWAIDLPKSAEIEKEIERQGLIKTIKDEHVSKLDSQMLTFSTDTDAPKSLSELFVQPKLTLKTDIDSETEENIDDLTNILNNKENYLLFGTKESGKTVLLNRKHLIIKIRSGYWLK